MNKYPLILKESGESQPFLPSKLKASLHRAGAESTLIDEITNEIESWLTDGTTTKQIYRRAFSLLSKKRRSTAARYSLKKAIMELGPSGFPFEHFIGQIFRLKGFDVLVGQTVNGKCVTHEVDVIASDNGNQHLVECKYHNSQGKYSSVQVPLYIRSRVNDIIETRQALPEYKNLQFHGWVVTNTRFTTDATNYAICSGLNLMSWDYPEKDSLKALTEKYRAFPVTALTQLTKAQKQHLLQKEIILCSELKDNPQELDVLQIPQARQKKIMMEVNELCNGQKI